MKAWGAFIIEGRTEVIIQTKQTKKGCLNNTFAEKYVINSLKKSEKYLTGSRKDRHSH